MTFRLADPKAAYPTPVVVDVPAADGPQRHECVLHFRLLSGEKYRDLAAEGDAALLRRVVAGWDDISAADGEPLEFSAENLSALTDIPYFSRAVVDAYLLFMAGLPGKTSARPRSGGSAGKAGTRSKRTRRR